MYICMTEWQEKQGIWKPYLPISPRLQIFRQCWGWMRGTVSGIRSLYGLFKVLKCNHQHGHFCPFVYIEYYSAGDIFTKFVKCYPLARFASSRRSPSATFEHTTGGVLGSRSRLPALWFNYYYLEQTRNQSISIQLHVTNSICPQHDNRPNNATRTVYLYPDQPSAARLSLTYNV